MVQRIKIENHFTFCRPPEQTFQAMAPRRSSWSLWPLLAMLAAMITASSALNDYNSAFFVKFCIWSLFRLPA